MRRRIVSEPDWSGICMCLAIREDPDINRSSSSLQSMGSTELSRNRGTEVRSSKCSSSRVNRGLPSKSLPHRPRLIPVKTISGNDPSRCRTCFTTASAGMLRLPPRTDGMMQNEQRLWHPSWTLTFGRDRPSPSPAGRAAGFVSESMLPTRIPPASMPP